VGALTLEQIRALYTGQIRNWKDLGGPDQPIVIIIYPVATLGRGVRLGNNR
jgi:phosphate transport system substrate-binding protein